MAKHKQKILHNPIEKHFSTITRYHYYIYFCLFSSKVPIFWHVLNLIFLSPPMDHICEGTNLTNSCPCDEPVWDRSVFTETIQTKFGLFCNTRWMISFSNCVMYIGLLVGALLFGILSDKYGRLSAFSISCLILGVAGSLVAAMPTAPAFLVMRCIEGIGSGGSIVTSFVLCIEYSSVKHRELITALYHLPINISHLTLPGVSYALRNCDDFQLAISVPVFLCVAMRWLLTESPKWLMDSERIEEAATVMERFGALLVVLFYKTCNGTTCENIREELEEYNAHNSNKSRRKINFFHIFKHKKLTINLCLMSAVYFLTGMGYYGISQFIGKMSGDIFTNVAVSGALLLPGTISAIFLLKILSRRTFLMASVFLSGVFILIETFIPTSYIWSRVVLACICNCFFFMSFIIVFLYGVELFPTSVRNSVLGFLSVLSRIGQIAAPLINLSSEMAAGITFGVLALSGTIFVYFLPETKDTELPSSLDDTKTLTRRKSILAENVTSKNFTEK